MEFTKTSGGRTVSLYVGSSENMIHVRDDSVSLTVTSPPYWNAIDYDRHAENPEQSYRTRQYKSGFDDYQSYITWATRIFGEVLKKTRPGGFLAVVVGTVLCDGVLYPVPFDLVSSLTRSGWLFHQDIVWHKVTAGVKRAGVFIQHPYPGYYHPNIMNEYILIFRKPGAPIHRTVAPEVKANAKYQIDALFTKEIANNVWHIAPVPPGTLNHPCPFPEDIPFRLIQLYSYPGDTVLDPFLGSGQTTKVAWALGRSTIGYDIVEEYVRYAFQRLDEPLAVREKQLVAEYKHADLGAPLGALGRARHGRTRHGAGLRSRKRNDEPKEGDPGAIPEGKRRIPLIKENDSNGL
ncbi:MAG: site-specific DNA-methyltransferase [Firmicutes bacterium]|nr:site-specific DNA-methyltransferase [Candidatus Fermentithermobacillaceae bacterium]